MSSGQFSPLINLLETLEETGFSPGQISMFLRALHNNGWARRDIAELGQSGERMQAVLRYVRKKAEIWEPRHRRCEWREVNGVIYFTVTSDGTTGPEWVKRLESRGCSLSPQAKNALYSTNFQPTHGVTYEIAVIKGERYHDGDRNTRKIRDSSLFGFSEPNAEVSCLIWKMFIDEEIKEMGLESIVAMHEPILVSGGFLVLLTVSRHGDGSWLIASPAHSGKMLPESVGFAFN
ncbi:MAG: hypothetical protein WD049_05395 [Candidatus Paceibacterota bacterium]